MSSRVSLRRARRALVVAMGLLGSVGAQAASAVTVRVDDDRAQCPDASFRRISPALAAVPPDSTVVVCPGTYVEALRMNKPGVRVIGLRGRHSDIVLMQAPGADPSIPMVEMSAPDTTLAAVKSRISVAPAWSIARAQALAVAPVVSTSSTSTTTWPAT